MRHARLENSARLRRMLGVLIEADGEISSWDLMARAEVVAPSTCISELRMNGCEIETEVRVGDDGQRRWFYTLRKKPEGW